MNEITKLQWVADKKHWRVVAGHVPVALFGVKLQRKASRVACRIRGTFLAAYGGEPNKRWRLLADRVKQLRRRVLGDLFARAHEISVRARALRVHYALRNAFAVEMRHFFKQQVIFKNDWTARSYCQRILVVAHRTPRVRCHCVFLFFCHLSSGFTIRPREPRTCARPHNVSAHRAIVPISSSDTIDRRSLYGHCVGWSETLPRQQCREGRYSEPNAGQTQLRND